MFCPECGDEYREGFFECADCGVPLVEELPELPEPEHIPDAKLVTVLETGDPNELAFAESVLEDAGIPFVKLGDGLQGLYALGHLAFGFNPIVGPVILQVSEEHAGAAAQLLAESEQAELEGAEDLGRAGSARGAGMKETAAEPEPAEVSTAAPDSRKLRLWELALVLGIAFLPSILASLYHWWIGARPTPETEFNGLIRLVHAGLAISLLAYVLYWQGNSLRGIGLTFRVSDVLWALPLAFFSQSFAIAVGRLLLAYSVSFPKLPPSTAPSWLTWLSIIPWAAEEELIVRAYLMTEVSELTGSMAIAVFASVGFQVLYHLYQGTPAALVHAGAFFVAAVFYAYTRRITPVILAHALHNFWVLAVR
jgi:membrane protease YdiL (CAAX protease family)